MSASWVAVGWSAHEVSLGSKEYEQTSRGNPAFYLGHTCTASHALSWPAACHKKRCRTAEVYAGAVVGQLCVRTQCAAFRGLMRIPADSAFPQRHPCNGISVRTALRLS